MTNRLRHTYPRWEPPESGPWNEDDLRETWLGEMRIVHGQRARKLRRRRVPLMYLGRTSAGRAEYAWFVDREFA